MNTDKELLELAAKASGIEIWFDGNNNCYTSPKGFIWDPLQGDGDALRLAVKLGITLDVHTNIGEGPQETTTWAKSKCFIEMHKQDPYAATRRAIVRAAAEIGKSMEKTNET